jgi:hypothetical protein
VTEAFPRLSRRARAAILAFCVALFLVVQGPIWKHPYNPDASILWSYAPIPLLVLAALLVERKARLSTFLLETVLLAMLKFGVTASILISIWTFSTPPPMRKEPPHVAAVRPTPVHPAPEPAFAPTPIPAAETGTVAGRATLADGRPASGALVYVSAGLESYRFATAAGAASVSVGAGTFLPDLVAARFLRVTSRDGRLHTLDARTDRETLANIAVLASGTPRDIALPEARGIVSLRCDLHPAERGTAVVVAHPFVTTADADGRFELRGVPAGALELAAVTSTGAAGRARVELARGARAVAEIALD